MTRFKNADWNLQTDSEGKIRSWEQVHAALLMDVRDELQTLNRVFRCPNFLAIPQTLTRISRNTAKPRRRRQKVAV